jgi:hypothetical protein
MVERNCLLIDDEMGRQKRIFENSVATPLKKDGIKANLIPIDTTEKQVQTEEQIDRAKLKSFIEDAIRQKKIDVVACDYELASDVINGIGVIELVKGMRKKVPIYLYSGKFNKIIGDIIKRYDRKEPDSIKSCVREIKQIYGLGIKDFLDRDDYPSQLVGLLKKQEDTVDDVFSKKIREYDSLVFKSCYPDFKGMNLGEIANHIDSESHQGSAFLDELIEQTVAYMIKVNQDE